MTFRNILLDGGGVILDESGHEAAIGRLLIDLISERLPDYSEGDLKTDIEEAVHRYCPKVYSYILWKRIPDERIYLQYRDRFLTEWRRPPLRLTPGIESQLAVLAEEYSLLLAGQYGKEIVDLLEEHGLLRYFSGKLTQDDYAITKPDPRYFEQILSRHRMTPDESIMVGDRIDNDVIPAKMIGMKTIRVRLGMHAVQEPRLPDERPDLEICSVRELAAAVRKIHNSAS